MKAENTFQTSEILRRVIGRVASIVSKERREYFCDQGLC